MSKREDHPLWKAFVEWVVEHRPRLSRDDWSDYDWPTFLAGADAAEAARPHSQPAPIQVSPPSVHAKLDAILELAQPSETINAKLDRIDRWVARLLELVEKLKTLPTG